MIEFFDSEGVIGTVRYADGELTGDRVLNSVVSNWLARGNDPSSFEEAYAHWSNGYTTSRRVNNDQTDTTGPVPLAVAAAARDDKTEGAMIALIPSAADLERLSLDGYEEPDELHLTLFYLGDADQTTPTQVNELVTALLGALRGMKRTAPVTATTFGVAHWNPTGEHPAWVLNVGDGGSGGPSALEEMHSLVYDVLRDSGIDYPPQHTPWQPHICIAYSKENLYSELSSRLGPVTFDTLRVAWGEYDIDIRLGEQITASATVEEFHLPGKHDQDSHGHPGGLTKKSDDSRPDAVMSISKFNERRDNAAEGDGVYGVVSVDDSMESVVNLLEEGQLTGVTADDVSSAYLHYTDLGYTSINRGLRQSNDLSSLSANDRVATKTLDRVIAASPLTSDAIVYRGIVDPRKTFGDAYVDSDEENANRGLTWIDNGFTSTSVSIDAFDLFGGSGQGIALNILVPKGYHASGTPESTNENEYEIILPRGTTFRVVASRRNDDGQMEFDVEVIPNDVEVTP